MVENPLAKQVGAVDEIVGTAGGKQLLVAQVNVCEARQVPPTGVTMIVTTSPGVKAFIITVKRFPIFPALINGLEFI